MFVILSFNENTKHFLVNHILHNFASTVGFLSSAFSSPPVARVAQAPALRTVAVAVLLETFLNSTNSCKHSWFPFTFSSPLVARVAQAPALRAVAVAVLLETFLNSTNSCKHDWFPFVCFLIATRAKKATSDVSKVASSSERGI